MEREADADVSGHLTKGQRARVARPTLGRPGATRTEWDRKAWIGRVRGAKERKAPVVLTDGGEGGA